MEVIVIKKVFLYFIVLLSLIGVVYSVFFLSKNIREYKVSENKYEELRDVYDQPETDKHQELKEISEDYIGWLSVDGTDIEYPVVYGNDNDFYLNHNAYKEEDRAGAIYMDYRNSGEKLDSNTIVYGHNMKDSSMFGSLANVLQEDFAEGNRIHLDLPDESYEWEIFSAYKTYETDWMQVGFESGNGHTQFVDDLKNKSQKSFADGEDDDNKVITLATCTVHDSDERVVVHASLKKGEE